MTQTYPSDRSVKSLCDWWRKNRNDLLQSDDDYSTVAEIAAELDDFLKDYGPMGN